MKQISNKAFRKNLLGLLLLICSSFLTVSAYAAPAFSKQFTPDTIGPGSVSTLTFTIENANEEVPVGITDLAFTDALPAGLTIATPANASTTCADGSVSAPDAGSTISLSGGQVAASASCVVNVDVTSSTTGTHMNTSGVLTSSAGSSGTASADLTVDSSRPGFSKVFSPDTVPLGSRSTLTFTIDNSANGSNASLLNFTDTFPSGLVIADPANASTDCVAAILTATPGTTVVSLIGGFLFEGATCTVSVDVVGNAIGQLDNSSGELNFDGNSSGKANAALNVTGSNLSLVKSFLDDPVSPGSTVDLQFTISNRDRSNDATFIAFSDSLETTLTGLEPAVMALPDPCGAGSALSFTTTTGTLSLSNGSLAAGESCTFSLSLTVPGGSAAGAYPNTTSLMSAAIGGRARTFSAASDTLFVSDAPKLTKEFIDDPAAAGGSVTLEFTITNVNSASGVTELAFTDDLETAIPGLSANNLVSGMTDAPLLDVCGTGSKLTVHNPPDIMIGMTTIVTPPIPTLLEFTSGSLAAAGSPGDSCTFSVVLDIPVGTAGGIYTNTSSEITGEFDGSTPTIGPAASGDLIVSGAPSLTKAFTDDPVLPGGTVTMELTLSHSAEASGDATAITFTDDLAPVLAGLVATGLPLAEACDADGPGGDPGTGTLTGSAGDTLLTLAGATLSPGESCTISISLTLPANAAPGDYTNTTSGVGATVDGLASTSAPAADDLKIAGLTFTKEFLTNPVLPGTTTTLRFSLENISPNATDNATNIEFTDNLDAVLSGLAVTGTPTNGCGGTLTGTTTINYTGGSLTVGTNCTIDVDVLVPLGAAVGEYRNTTSNLSATTDSGAVTIDPATDDLIINSNLIQLTKSFTNDPVAPGDTVNLRFTLNNLDQAQAASAIAFTDDLGAVLPGLAATGLPIPACGGTASGTDTITLTNGALAAGAECEFNVSVQVPAAATASTYSNTSSSITGVIGGLAVIGDSATDNLEVINPLTFSKSFDAPSTASGTTTLTFSITNPGSNSVSDFSFFDNLDNVISGLSAVATSLPAEPCGAGSSITGSSVLTFVGGSLPPLGGMCSFDVDLDIPAVVAPDDYLNTTSDLSQQGIKVSDPATATLTIFLPDMDGDGILDDDDNCPADPNPLQEDLDGDDIGDACDPDIDGDTVLNEVDNCPINANLGQEDEDNDGIGDACDSDTDGDGVPNETDMCPNTPSGGIVDPSSGCTIDQLCPCASGIYERTRCIFENKSKYSSAIVRAALLDRCGGSGLSRNGIRRN